MLVYTYAVAKWINQSSLLEADCVRRFGEQMEFCLRDIYRMGQK